jgi:hypothetical protein
MASPKEEIVASRLALMTAALQANGPACESDDAYFVRAWTAAGTPFARAVELAREPLTVFIALQVRPLGLEAILADQHATYGLKQCLIQDNLVIRKALVDYAKRTKPKGKPGPRPDANGLYKTDIAGELSRQGLTSGQIRIKMNLGPNGRSLASALVSQAKKKNKLRQPAPAGQ